MRETQNLRAIFKKYERMNNSYRYGDYTLSLSRKALILQSIRPCEKIAKIERKFTAFLNSYAETKREYSEKLFRGM